MFIRSAEFHISAAELQQIPKRPLPHIAVVGRSNVGKSSLLNALLGRRALAKTSGTPGKTRLLNFFLVNDELFLVDLPGYGFARVSKAERQDWARLIEGYLLNCPRLACLLLLIDIRHSLASADGEMVAWLRHHQIPHLIALTKADKLSRKAAEEQQAALAQELALPVESCFITSSVQKSGMVELWHAMENLLRPARP
jgi:GTP-binding protein